MLSKTNGRTNRRHKITVAEKFIKVLIEKNSGNGICDEKKSIVHVYKT